MSINNKVKFGVSCTLVVSGLVLIFFQNPIGIVLVIVGSRITSKLLNSRSSKKKMNGN